MRLLGMIPARAGSKRLPDKAVLPLGGRPLIEHTVVAARDAGVCDEVCINTDSRRIADIAVAAGATCPVLRPTQLAADETPTRDAVVFMLEHYQSRGQVFDAVMILQPTSPLRSVADIRNAWRMYETHAPCNVVSVSPVAPASWLGQVNESGRFERNAGEQMTHRLNGAIYIHGCVDYLAGREPAKTVAYTMPPERGVDIDTPRDFEYAEYLLRHRAVNTSGGTRHCAAGHVC